MKAAYTFFFPASFKVKTKYSGPYKKAMKSERNSTPSKVCKFLLN